MKTNGGVGCVWKPEFRDSVDPLTGVAVRQLTNYRGHSHLLYLTHRGWYDNGRRLLFGSDRGNRTNLFSVHIDTGEILQLTNMKPVAPPHEVLLLWSTVDAPRNKVYFSYDQEVLALDISSLQLTPLWRLPKGFRYGVLDHSADSRHLYVGIFEDLSAHVNIDYWRGYVGFSETWNARPWSRIMRIATDGSGAEIVWEEQNWIWCIEASPTQPHLVMFGYEGCPVGTPNRIWIRDVDAGQTYAIRPDAPDEQSDHEYWMADGVNVGYHVTTGDGYLLGCARFDGSGRSDYPTGPTGHTHSVDFSLVVGDAGRVLRLWQWNGHDFNPARHLCTHRSSSHIQQTHPHPRFTNDRRHIVYCSDVSGYGNIYLVEVPDPETLPLAED